MSSTSCYALIPCAGVGQRAGAAGPKQYALLRGVPLVAHTLAALAAVARIRATLVVLAPDDAWFEGLVPARAGLWTARCGGATRAASVRAGLQALRAQGAADDDWVLVHDAARCLLQPAWVERLIDACADDAVGGLLALPLTDTLKQADEGAEGAARPWERSQASAGPPQACLTPSGGGPDAVRPWGRSVATVDRSGKWAAQTPQMFRLALLERALAAAGDAATDEASAVERLGLQPRLVTGDADNLKITWPADFARAERLLEMRTPPAPTPPPALRVGEGWDTHALVAGRPLVLGGVVIPHSHGLLGHSDADALLHAITDALLGAAGLGDIGRHFPDTDPAFAGADSGLLLQEAAKRVRAAGWTPVNLDTTIVAQAPKMAPHIAAMRERIATLLALPAAAVNVKAKTAEKMGPVGEGRAIETRAVCLLWRADGVTRL